MDARQKAIAAVLTRAAQLVHDASFGSSPATEYEMKAEAKLLRALAAEIEDGRIKLPEELLNGL